MWLVLAFLAIPVIEIAIFIQVGGLIGLWPTLGLVLLFAVIGTIVVRSQGAQAMVQLRRALSDLTDPSEPLAHGAMILFAGALLVTPGFFTDLFGFALLFPPVRLAVFRWLRSRVRIQGFAMGQRAAGHRPATDEGIIDGDFEDVPPGKLPTHQPSGWTRH